MQIISFSPQTKTTLDILLKNNLPQKLNREISNSKIRRLIIAGCVKINGQKIRIPSYTVFANSKVEVFVAQEKIFFEKSPCDIEFNITPKSVLFEDDYLIFINKPTHFPTEKTIVENRDNLHDAVVRYLWNKNPSLKNPPYVGIMHRLDRETSGVILFTKRREINKAIFDMFDSNKLDLSSDFSNEENLKLKPVKKTYIAVVKDSSSIKENFIVKNYLGRISAKSSACKWGIVSAQKGGLIAITKFNVLKRKNGKCYLVCKPITGRTHQIRVHLAGLGFAIIGDSLYGGEKYERLCLHSSCLELIHPITNNNLTVTADWNF